MQDRKIRQVDIAKAARLELIVFIALDRISRWLKAKGIPATQEYNYQSRGGRGHSRVDHVIVIRHSGFSFRCFVEDKNWNNTKVSLLEICRRAVIKLRHQGFLAGWDGRNFDMMYIVGHMNISKSVITILTKSEIHYLDLGQLNRDDVKLLTDAMDLFIGEIILRITEVIDLSSTAKPFELKMIDKEKVVVKNGSQEWVLDLTVFPNNAFIFLDRYEPINFIQMRRGKRGSITILSPWKAKSGNASIGVKNRHYNKTFWEIQISEHGPSQGVETLVIRTSKSSK